MFISVVLDAQVHIKSVEKFTVEDGLSQNSVHSLYQDSRGLLWIGTEGGINKFDGYEITPYHYFEKKSIFTTRGAIYDITEDDNGDIWFSSVEALSRLNINSEYIENLRDIIAGSLDLSFETILSVYQDTRGNIWFGSFGQGLFKIDKNFQSVENFKNDPDSTGDSSLDYIRDFFEDENGNLWLATYGGLVMFDTQADEFENVFYAVANEELKHVTVLEILNDGSRLLLATNNLGILVYDPQSGVLSEFSEKLNQDLRKYTIRDIKIDPENRIWLAAEEGGVFVIDKGTKSLARVNDLVNNEISDALLKPLCLLFDNTGIAWIGTQLGGLYKITLGEKYFHTINNKQPGFKKIDDNAVFAVGEDFSGLIWISTPSGLYKVDRKNRTVRKLPISNLISSSYYKVYNILFKNNYAWLTLGEKLIKHDVLSGDYEVIELNFNGSLSDIVDISGDELFLGTSNNLGLIYDVKEENVTDEINFNVNPEWRVRLIEGLLDSTGILWMGTMTDIVRIDLKNQPISFSRVGLPASAEVIGSLSRLGDKIWFSTYGSGFLSYDITTEKFEHFTMKDGLPDDIIYGILTDNKGNLWMSSNRGISQFNPATKVFRNFNLKDGLQGYEYNSKAFLKTDDGEIFFGGINGLNYFYPHEIESNTNVPNTLITKVTLFDSTLTANVGSGINEVYKFDSHENSLSFEFVSLDFTDPSNNKYLYKLEGVNENWIQSGGKRSATFANMNPGEYTFLVKGSNNDHVYDESPAAFSFIIYPPFYSTWWFRSLLLCLVLVVLYSIYKVRMLGQEKRLREIEEIRKRIADDFHDDLGHKLTRITLYSEMIRNQDKFGADQKVYLDKISDASNSLFYETKDFIWSIDPEQDTVYDVLVYIKDFGDDFFSRTPVAFIVNEIDEAYKSYSLPMKMKRELVLIFKEAMNNVLKHSGADSAELRAAVHNSLLEVSLRDNGAGFDVDENSSKGRGIASMKQRAAVTDSKVEIDSGAKGTTVKFTTNLSEDGK